MKKLVSELRGTGEPIIKKMCEEYDQMKAEQAADRAQEKENSRSV